MAGWVRWQGPLQVRPCKLGRRIHAAHAPATGPTPPSIDSRDLWEWHGLLLVGVDLGRHVDPLHVWMLFVQLSKYSISMEIHPRMAWIYQTPKNCQRWGGVGLRGVRGMGPRHASGGLGRMPNPGLAVCAGQRTRASGGQAYRDVLAASPQSDTAPPPTGCTPLLLLLLLLRLPASGRHYRGCRAQPGRYSQRPSTTTRRSPGTPATAAGPWSARTATKVAGRPSAIPYCGNPITSAAWAVTMSNASIRSASV